LNKARYTELLSDYHKTVLTALGNVEDALVGVQQTAEQELRQQDAADKARRAFEFAQLQFQAGTTNVLTMLNTETALFTAQDALVQGKFAHLQHCSIYTRRSAAVGTRGDAAGEIALNALQRQWQRPGANAAGHLRAGRVGRSHCVADARPGDCGRAVARAQRRRGRGRDGRAR